MKRIIGYLMTVGVLLAFTSCCECSLRAGGGGVLTEGRWQLIQIEGRGVKAENDSYTLVFAMDNTVSGKGDCNRLTGNYNSDKSKGTLTFGPMASTRMMCPNQEQEDRFVGLIGAIDAYRVEKGLLMLFSNGELKMILEKRE